MQVAGTTPARITGTVKRLRLKGDETVLEVGCGRGVAADLLCGGLTTGRMLAIDRSSTAIDAAARRCQPHLASQRLQLVHTDLEHFSTPEQGFAIAFAINVNLFWLKAAAGLDVLRRTLLPTGRLFLAYEAPPGQAYRKIMQAVSANLTAGGFEVEAIEEAQSDGQPLIVRARLA